MCKTLKEELHDRAVIKVDIQQLDLNDDGFKSTGILVQNVPGGKYTDHIVIRFVLERSIMLVVSKNVISSNYRYF